MQYVECEFKRGGRRYTYHNDGEPVKAGDCVEVDGRNGRTKITVTGIVDRAPRFATKPILRVVPPDPDPVPEPA